MGKYKFFLKNIGFLAVSQFGTKLIGFFLIPLYTNVLSATEYGTYDIFTTSINLLIPILTLNIAEATLRYAIDIEINKEEIFSISINLIIRGSFIVGFLLIVNHLLQISILIDQYAIFFVLLFFVSALNSVVSCFARGINYIKEVSVAGVLTSSLIMILNVLFLLLLDMGLTGYFLATIIGLTVGTVLLLIKIRVWDIYIFLPSNQKLKKEMLSYSKPMIANSISWWINSVSDRYIVTWLCGLAANGIYAVGYKIPSILNIFQTIFNQAWTLSAVRDFNAEDESGFFSKIYNLYNFGMVIICSFMIVLTKLLARLLYAKDFYEAWKYVPFLMLSVVFGALSGYLGGIFSAVKQSKIFAQSTTAGAVINIILNFVLIEQWGTIGAAVATAISYGVVWGIRIKQVKKHININISFMRDFVVYGILVVQSILLIKIETQLALLYLLELLLIILVIFLFRKEVMEIRSILMRR